MLKILTNILIVKLEANNYKINFAPDFALIILNSIINFTNTTYMNTKRISLGLLVTVLLFGISSIEIDIDEEGESQYIWNSLVANNDTNENLSLSEAEDLLITERLNQISGRIPLEFNSLVKKQLVKYFKNPTDTELLLGRAQSIRPIFYEKLAEANLPSELAYLPIIESRLEGDVTSSAGAHGYWQFMKATGKEYELRINHLIDERRDPASSTVAAAAYLNDLYGRYGDWLLALSAYNAGPGNVNKAIKRAGGKTDYWEIRHFLPRETRYYIPKFIAAIYIMSYHSFHGIQPITPELGWKFEYLLTLDNDIKISDLEQMFGVNPTAFKRLNPAILTDLIPASSKPIIVRMPYSANMPIVSSVTEKKEKKEVKKLPTLSLAAIEAKPIQLTLKD